MNQKLIYEPNLKWRIFLKDTWYKILAKITKLPNIGTNNQSVRDFWLKDTLTNISPGSRILDAGAGELKYKPYCEHLIYTSQDFCQYDGQGDGIGLQTCKWDQNQIDIISDISQIPRPDESFDAVMCIEVLEHVPNPVDAIRELTRLLRENGSLIITAPFCALTHYAPFFYQTGYSRYFYEYWLEKFGYEILDMQWNGNFFTFLAQELHRLESIIQKSTDDQLSLIERFAIKLILKALERFSESDSGSNQLLSFGIHVHAVKKINKI
jgi:2-polyprenyl-3-methyl-5-hydroxy-6-metoxy-1,4-benzoquinol methylase